LVALKDALDRTLASATQVDTQKNERKKLAELELGLWSRHYEKSVHEV
jgi:hypothetical protein|tara:strand:- start:2632 stop:2775 length:144 start_codon:yes stop_codon:yes gene_type:complete